MNKTNVVNLVLVGFGNVGKRFSLLLREKSSDLPFRSRVVGVATANHGCFLDPAGVDISETSSVDRSQCFSEYHDPKNGLPPTDAFELMARTAQMLPRDSTHRLVVVENTPFAIENGEPGVQHVREALKLGFDVITANKGPAAFAHRELKSLARKSGLSFLFEGTVLDGLPVFNLIRQALPSIRIVNFRGILNTTTNYLLFALENGRSFQDALVEMQSAGIAEANIAYDVNGWDAAAKTAILANELLGAELTPHGVDRKGLDTLQLERRMRAAQKQGRTIKLVASAKRTEGKVLATVEPIELSTDDPLAQLKETAKGLLLETDLLGNIQISKAASNVSHTAYALLSDLITLNRQ